MDGEVLSDERKRCLNNKALIEALDLDKSILLDELLTKNVITPENKEVIEACGSVKDKAECLIEILKQGSNGMYMDFCNSLVKGSKRHHLITEYLICASDLSSAVDKLMNYYVNEFCCINLYSVHREPHMVQIDKIYVPMDLVHRVTGITGPRDEPKQSQSCILQQLEDTDRILVEGSAGKGKTTLIKWICWTWTKQNQAEDDHPLSRFKVVIPILLRLVEKGFSLFEILRKQFHFLNAVEICAILQFHKENPKEVLLLMDGYDEFQNDLSPEIDNLILKRSQIKPASPVITTTRPERIAQLKEFMAVMKLYYKLCGFTNDHIKEYMKLFFADEEDGSQIAAVMYDTLMDSHSSLVNLARIPALLEPMCLIWNRYRKMGKTAWEVYWLLVRCLLDRLHDKYPMIFGIANKGKIEQIMLDQLAKLANTWNDDRSLCLTFSSENLDETLGAYKADVSKLGCLYKSHPASYDEMSHWSFLHRRVQEFFLAHHLLPSSNETETEKFVNICSTETGIGECCSILRLICEKHPAVGLEILQKVMKKYRGSVASQDRLLGFLFHMLHHLDCVQSLNIVIPLHIQDKAPTNVSFSTVFKQPSKQRNIEFSVQKTHNDVKNSEVDVMIKGASSASIVQDKIIESSQNLSLNFDGLNKYDIEIIRTNAKLTNLVLKKIGNTQFLPEVASLGTLKVLHLEECVITENTLDNLKSVPTIRKLEQLVCWNTELKGCGKQLGHILSHQKNLAKLICCGNKFECSDLTAIVTEVLNRGPPKLIREMWLTENALGGAGTFIGRFAYLQQNLTVLNMSDLGLTSKDIEKIGYEYHTENQQIEFLTLDNNPGLAESDAIYSFLKCLRNLEKLHMRHCGFTSTNLKQIPCKMLKTLALCRNNFSTDDNFSAISESITKLEKLEELSLSKCVNSANSGSTVEENLQSFVKNLPETVIELDLSNNAIQLSWLMSNSVTACLAKLQKLNLLGTETAGQHSTRTLRDTLLKLNPNITVKLPVIL